jgi:hypothetical protein
MEVIDLTAGTVTRLEVQEMNVEKRDGEKKTKIRPNIPLALSSKYPSNCRLPAAQTSPRE